MLRTRSPVYSPLRAFSLDLHVLGTPPAFVLSQDQTLQLSIGASNPKAQSLSRLTAAATGASTPHSAAKRSAAVHSKHCEFRNPSSWTCYPVFRDRPGTPFLTPHFRRPRLPAVSNTPARGPPPTAANCCASRALLRLPLPPSEPPRATPIFRGRAVYQRQAPAVNFRGKSFDAN